ncbi:hypothetical protein J3E73DRAFT_428513 [Bipolaris maydis]|nr:hypothetical protein J3E73DRAFT_428513 [Bipolaris maydis]
MMMKKARAEQGVAEGSLEAASLGPEETSQSGHTSDDGSTRVHNPFTIAVESEASTISLGNDRSTRFMRLWRPTAGRASGRQACSSESSVHMDGWPLWCKQSRPHIRTQTRHRNGARRGGQAGCDGIQSHTRARLVLWSSIRGKGGSSSQGSRRDEKRPEFSRLRRQKFGVVHGDTPRATYLRMPVGLCRCLPCVFLNPAASSRLPATSSHHPPGSTPRPRPSPSPSPLAARPWAADARTLGRRCGSTRWPWQTPTTAMRLNGRADARHTPSYWTYTLLYADLGAIAADGPSAQALLAVTVTQGRVVCVEESDHDGPHTISFQQQVEY